MNHEHAQREFYEHLKKHPNAHLAAKSFARKIVARDPYAIRCLRDLAAKAQNDERSANALRIVAVTMKYEQPDSMIAGGIPQAIGKVSKYAAAPISWVLNQSGHAFEWVGTQFHNVARGI